MKKLSMEELERLSVQEYKETQKSPLVLVLDNVRSLNNVVRPSVLEMPSALKKFTSAALQALLHTETFKKRPLAPPNPWIGNIAVRP